MIIVMDNTTPASAPSVTPPLSPPPTPQPTPPVEPVLSTSPAAPTSPTPPAASMPAHPFPLKWAILGIAVIVVLAGSILGILGANNAQKSAQTTETRAAAAPETVPGTIVKWPYGSLPNVMIEKNTLRIEEDEATGNFSIHGNIIFAKALSTGSELWTVWASTDTKGKEIVGTTFPKGNAQLYPPAPPFKNPGTFTADASGGYPASGMRKTAPAPYENEGVLKNSSTNIQPHYFDIYNVKIPKSTCTIYLNYRSNRQGGNSTGNASPVFYEVTVPGCPPKVTPPPVLITHVPPPGCQVLNTYGGTSGENNYSQCSELCGQYTDATSCAKGDLRPGTKEACVIQSCRSAVGNPSKWANGAWFCCKRGADCTKSCQTDKDCSGGLMCNDGQCGDRPDCTKSTCFCGPDEKAPFPTTIKKPTPTTAGPRQP